MLDLLIRPGIGAGSIELGMAKDVVRRKLEDLGYPLSAEHGKLDYFCDNSLQIEYEDEKIRFIGISDHPEIKCTFYDVDVFDCEATVLFEKFAINECTSPDVPPGETCFFPHQGLYLWESDEQYDRKGNYKRRVYAQVGIERPASA